MKKWPIIFSVEKKLQHNLLAYNLILPLHWHNNINEEIDDKYF
jgi:hypothetical protein